jgi:hypothetical protein
MLKSFSAGTTNKNLEILFSMNLNSVILDPFHAGCCLEIFNQTLEP